MPIFLSGARQPLLLVPENPWCVSDKSGASQPLLVLATGHPFLVAVVWHCATPSSWFLRYWPTKQPREGLLYLSHYSSLVLLDNLRFTAAAINLFSIKHSFSNLAKLRQSTNRASTCFSVPPSAALSPPSSSWLTTSHLARFGFHPDSEQPVLSLSIT